MDAVGAFHYCGIVGQVGVRDGVGGRLGRGRLRRPQIFPLLIAVYNANHVAGFAEYVRREFTQFVGVAASERGGGGEVGNLFGAQSATKGEAAQQQSYLRREGSRVQMGFIKHDGSQ